jgi:hypothetical protein
MPTWPPAQVTRVITYVLIKGGLQADGTPSGSAQWNNGAGLYSAGGAFGFGEGRVDYAMRLFENGGGTPVDPITEADAPDLATANWLWDASLFNNLDPVGPYFLADGAPVVNVGIDIHTDSATCVHTGGDPAGAYRPQSVGSTAAIPGFTGFDWKFAVDGNGFMRCANPPRSGEAGGIKFNTLEINGSATWLAWWWHIPEENQNGLHGKTPCGEDQTDVDAPYLYRWQNPGAPWVKINPADYTAHPTPVVVSVEPDHGPIVGGTLCTIWGEGFGVEATVTFDGVPATSVIVYSQKKITCVAPSHVAGSVTVVVTNFDGVHS